MGCSDGSCCSSGTRTGAIEFPGTQTRAWKMYNHLIAGIPEGILVKDYALGQHWSYLTAECGGGCAYTFKGGARRQYATDLRGMELRDVAQLAKSWSFEEASLGIAALNAWYNRHELLDPLGATYDETIEHEDGSSWKLDAFELYRRQIMAAPRRNVTVVGHFPHLDRVEEYAQVTVLERNCTQDNDTPDPACEYVMPDTDFAFITGTTFTNKTLPRLLDLTVNATTVLVGPSTVMSPFMFEWGVETLAGSVVADPEALAFSCKSGSGRLFGGALQMAYLKAPVK